MDTYVICPEHGELWVQRNAGPGAAPNAAAAEACQDWVPKPVLGLAIQCPRCASSTGLGNLVVEHREAETAAS